MSLCVNILVCVVPLLVLLNPYIAYGSNKKTLYVFGDSLFDVGNNQYYTPTAYIVANHPPYGASFTSATGRYSDGLLVPDFIANFEDMPLIPPVLDPTANGTFGYNFASYGAGVLNEHPSSINLDEQLELFENVTRTLNETTGSEETMNTLNNAVYLFSIGGNDYFNYFSDYPNATETEEKAYVTLIITRLTNGIKEIYGKGGRKFAFQDVGPIGCLPVAKYSEGIIEGCYEPTLKLAVSHNIALREALRTMKESEDYGYLKYGVFDYYTHLLDRLLNPTDYGFTMSAIACCGMGGYVNGVDCGVDPYFLCSNPSSFVMFDGTHTTQSTNSQLAKLMWSGDQSLMAPYNVKQLFQDDDGLLQVL